MPSTSNISAESMQSVLSSSFCLHTVYSCPQEYLYDYCKLKRGNNFAVLTICLTINTMADCHSGRKCIAAK